MLSGPPLDFACLVVVFGNDCGETTVCWDHDVSCVGLQRSGGHVLDGITVAECNDEVVVLRVRVGLFRTASDGYSALRLPPLALCVERECERRLAQAICLLIRARGPWDGH